MKKHETSIGQLLMEAGAIALAFWSLGAWLFVIAVGIGGGPIR